MRRRHTRQSCLYNNSIIIGDSESTGAPHNGTNVIAVNQQTGSLLWMTQVDSHPAAIITGSPVVVGNVVYQGISSMEEALALDKSYACCTFRGSVVALDAATGKIFGNNTPCRTIMALLEITAADRFGSRPRLTAP